MTVDTAPLLETNISDLPLWRRGKVRDVYDLGDRLLIVATDRISAFDHVLPTGIPDKGVVLTQLSLYWFEELADLVESHVMTADVSEYPEPLRSMGSQLAGRSMIVRKTEPLPVECVVRGYLAGSGFKDYRATGAVCGIRLQSGLRESDRLDPAIFTPSTKADEGHDENIPFEQVPQCLVSRLRMQEPLAEQLADRLRDLSLRIYGAGRERAEQRGLILADTKFEFGLEGDRLLWIDEALTPDSSRFWPRDGYQPGRSQPSFDKQYVRDYLESLGWDKKSAPPTLPAEVVARTRDKYREAYTRITGRAWPGLDARGGTA